MLHFLKHACRNPKVKAYIFRVWSLFSYMRVKKRQVSVNKWCMPHIANPAPASTHRTLPKPINWPQSTLLSIPYVWLYSLHYVHTGTATIFLTHVSTYFFGIPPCLHNPFSVTGLYIRMTHLLVSTRPVLKAGLTGLFTPLRVILTFLLMLAFKSKTGHH